VPFFGLRRFAPPRRDVKEAHLKFSGEQEMAKENAKGKSGGGGGGPKEMLLVASKVRQMIKDAGCNTAGDALDGLNGYVAWLVSQAARRAAENGRKTVRAHDFHIP